ncbi:DUF4386 domain-containing protein [Dactylosporangium sp. CS-033363]|uniref:DUF4386 domain-containing protein n=1 Tax=Dactylosporangium sp. CS-033363 TaxID=3239935 RepID=UPI003D8D00E4
MNRTRMIGALFLAGFLFYGVGFALVGSAIGDDGALTARSTLVAGALLMLLNVLVDVGKGVLFFPILNSRGQYTALLYLTMMAIEAVLLGFGVTFLLMLVPLHDRAADPVFGLLAVDANNIVYQIGEFLLGFAGVFLCLLLARTRWLPRALAWFGAIGYAIFAAGTVGELLGVPVGLALSIPGGLFEVVLGVFLLVRGAQQARPRRPLGRAKPVPAVG